MSQPAPTVADVDAWASGTLAEFAAPDAGRAWRLVCTADWMPRDDHVQAMQDDPIGFYGDLLPELTDADLRLVNVECVLGEKGAPIPKDGPNLRVDERTIASLTAVPFDVACLANNHTLDFGADGLARTIDVLQAAGLATVGAGLDGKAAARPLDTSIRGVPVRVINCGEGEECRSIDGGPGAYGLDLVAVAQQIERGKGAGAVVVVIFHGGREHVPVPPPYVVHDLRAIADLGADVVIGHHPHVPQGFEVHHGVPIAYSLGNFAFHFRTPQMFHHVGYALSLDFAGRSVRRVRAVPYLIEPTGLSLLDGPHRETFNNALARSSAALADPASLREAWDAVADHYVTADDFGTWLREQAEALATGDVGAAASLTNRFFTPAHRELFSRGLRNLAYGRQATHTAQTDLLNHYLETPLSR